MRDSFVDAEGKSLEGFPVAQNTISFREENGKTTVSSRSLYDTKEDRDKVIEMGVEAGVAQTLDRLERLLQTLK